MQSKVRVPISTIKITKVYSVGHTYKILIKINNKLTNYIFFIIVLAIIF